MELNLSELDTFGTNNSMNPYENFDYNSYEQNSSNYWENSNKKNTDTNIKKRKKVSFNDILSNMNLVVNRDGVLQFMGTNQEDNLHQSSTQQQPFYNQQPLQNQNNIRQVQYQPNQQITPFPQQNPNSEPLDPAVKHSYIFNKYFKDYVDPNVEKKGPRVPKTIEEYYKMILDDKIKAIQHRKKMEQIKSRKILFTSAPGAQLNPRNIQATRNNLRSMNFR